MFLHAKDGYDARELKILARFIFPVSLSVISVPELRLLVKVGLENSRSKSRSISILKESKFYTFTSPTTIDA